MKPGGVRPVRASGRQWLSHSEAIEVGKKFGSEQSGAFINGILDAVRKRIERGEIKAARSTGDTP